MEKGIIIWQSKYGATEKYVNWLKEETGFDTVRTAGAKADAVKEYDTNYPVRRYLCFRDSRAVLPEKKLPRVKR